MIFFFEFSHIFQPFFDDISAIYWSILIQNSVLERLQDLENLGNFFVILMIPKFYQKH